MNNRQLAASLSQLDNEIQGFEGSFQLQVSMGAEGSNNSNYNFGVWSFVKCQQVVDYMKSVDYWSDSRNRNRSTILVELLFNCA